MIGFTEDAGGEEDQFDDHTVGVHAAVAEAPLIAVIDSGIDSAHSDLRDILAALCFLAHISVERAADSLVTWPGSDDS